MRGQNSHRYMRKILWNNTFTVAIENTTPFSKASVLARLPLVNVVLRLNYSLSKSLL